MQISAIYSMVQLAMPLTTADWKYGNITLYVKKKQDKCLVWYILHYNRMNTKTSPELWKNFRRIAEHGSVCSSHCVLKDNFWNHFIMQSILLN